MGPFEKNTFFPLDPLPPHFRFLLVCQFIVRSAVLIHQMLDEAVLPAFLAKKPVLPAALVGEPVLPASLVKQPVLPAAPAGQPVLPASLIKQPVLAAAPAGQPVPWGSHSSWLLLLSNQSYLLLWMVN